MIPHSSKYLYVATAQDVGYARIIIKRARFWFSSNTFHMQLLTAFVLLGAIVANIEDGN